MATPNTKRIKLEKNRPCFEHGRPKHKASENIFSFLESSRFSPTKPTRLTPTEKIVSERKESQLKTSLQNGRFVNGPKNTDRVFPYASSDKMIPVPLILVSPHQAVQIKPEIELGLSAPQGLNVEETSRSQHPKISGSFAFDYELLPKLVEVHSSEPTLSLVRVQSNHYSHQINSARERFKKKGQDQKFSLGLPADEGLMHVSNPIYEQKCSPNQGLTTDDNNANILANIRLAQPPSPMIDLVSPNFRPDNLNTPATPSNVGLKKRSRVAHITSLNQNGVNEIGVKCSSKPVPQYNNFLNLPTHVTTSSHREHSVLSETRPSWVDKIRANSSGISAKPVVMVKHIQDNLEPENLVNRQTSLHASPATSGTSSKLCLTLHLPERTETDTIKEPEPVGDILMPTKTRKAYATAVTNNEQEKMDFVADRYASYEEPDLPQANAITEKGEKSIPVVACQPVMSSGNFSTKRKSEDYKGQKICNDVNNNQMSSTVCKSNGHEEAAHRRLNPNDRCSGIKPGSAFHKSKTTQVEKLERELSLYPERAVTSSQVKQTPGRNGRSLDSPFNVNKPVSDSKYAYIMRNEHAVPQACSINDPSESALDKKSKPEFSGEKVLNSEMKLNTNFQNCVDEKSLLARQRSNAKKANATYEIVAINSPPGQEFQLNKATNNKRKGNVVPTTAKISTTSGKKPNAVKSEKHIRRLRSSLKNDVLPINKPTFQQFDLSEAVFKMKSTMQTKDIEKPSKFHKNHTYKDAVTVNSQPQHFESIRSNGLKDKVKKRPSTVEGVKENTKSKRSAELTRKIHIIREKMEKETSELKKIYLTRLEAFLEKKLAQTN